MHEFAIGTKRTCQSRPQCRFGGKSRHRLGEAEGCGTSSLTIGHRPVIVSTDRRAGLRFGVGFVANHLAPMPSATAADRQTFFQFRIDHRWRRVGRVPAYGSGGYPGRCGDARGRCTRWHRTCGAFAWRESKPVRGQAKRFTCVISKKMALVSAAITKNSCDFNGCPCRKPYPAGS